MPSLTSLFLKIFKLGATAYGGPAMISHIKETTVNRYQWVKEGEFMRGVALCQLIPGATMVQIVTYVGYRVRGGWGALVGSPYGNGGFCSPGIYRTPCSFSHLFQIP